MTSPFIENECDSHPHDDQRICASNRDGEINVSHDFLRLELGLAVEDHTAPCNCLSCVPSGRSEFVPRKVYKNPATPGWLDWVVTWVAVDRAMIASD